MKAYRQTPKSLAFFVAVLLTLLPATPLTAGMLDTGALLHEANANAERAMLVERLGSGEVRDALARLGVDPADAQARVDRLTDSEVADLSARLDQLPAGGASTLEVVLIVFLVFVITDAIGLTNIFAFVQPVR